MKQAAGYQKTLYNSPYNGGGDTSYFGPEGKSKTLSSLKLFQGRLHYV